MLAAFASPDGQITVPRSAIAVWFASLGHGASEHDAERGILWSSAQRCFLAHDTVLDGWIDNIDALALELGSAGDNPALIYQAAVDRWGDHADQHIFGYYAAITVLPNGTLRLSRSPWSAPPLSYAHHQGQDMAASLPDIFFRVGLPKNLNYDRIADQLAMDWNCNPALSPYCGVEKVVPGSIVKLQGGRVETLSWYTAESIKPVRLADDAAYLSRAGELLEEAAACALRHTIKPVMALSGGLDSPIVAAELLAQMPERTRLPSITFVPDPDWAGEDAPGTVGDEWPTVERFAKMHPRLDPHRVEPASGAFDVRFRDLVAMSGMFNAGLAMFSMHHSVWAKARDLESDWLLSADLGNQSFSSEGHWAYAENFARLRWGRLHRLIKGRKHDPRSAVRKTLTLAALPHLPRKLRAKVLGFFHPERRDVLRWNSMLSGPARGAYRRRAKARGSHPVWEGFANPASRRAAIQYDLTDNHSDVSEITLALELIYGVRYRDVTAYRPLLEYCMGLPTDQFVRGETRRRLAKRLAVGRMPEEQYRAALTGSHNVDWHTRLKRERPRLLASIGAMRGHPWLAQSLDLDRMEEMLEQLPDTPSEVLMDNLPYMQGLSRAILAAQFIGYVEGRNDL